MTFTSFFGNRTSAQHKEATLEQPRFEQGANCLFAGHSYFVPPAKRGFDVVALLNPDRFPNHSFVQVLRSGIAGSPKKLWEDTTARQEIDTALSSGDVELFGMTYFSPDNSMQQHYQNFIDLALSYNSNTSIVIATPWMLAGGLQPYFVFWAFTALLAELAFGIVQKLRQANLNTRIYSFSHGVVGSIMYKEFKDGSLENITKKFAAVYDDAALFNEFGTHGGLMMEHVAGLLMLYELYTEDWESLQVQWSWNREDVEDIMAQAIEFNRPFELN